MLARMCKLEGNERSQQGIKYTPVAASYYVTMRHRLSAKCRTRRLRVLSRKLDMFTASPICVLPTTYVQKFRGQPMIRSLISTSYKLLLGSMASYTARCTTRTSPMSCHSIYASLTLLISTEGNFVSGLESLLYCLLLVLESLMLLVFACIVGNSHLIESAMKPKD